MKKMLRWLLCGCGRKGTFWDMISWKYPDVVKGFKFEMVRGSRREVLVHVRVVDLDNPMTVIWDFGIITLDKREGMEWKVVNLDAVTEFTPTLDEP